MTDVLHVQTRAYPLHYSTASLVTDTVTVPGYGTYRLRVGSLRSQAYNHDHTIEADLTDLVQAVVTLPGVEILACRARFLTSGTVLLVYALRHRVALRDLDTQALANYDAEINDALRSADSAVLGAAFDAAAAAGVVGGLTIRPGSAEELWPSGVGRNEVRYNCHFVVRRPAWRSDPRVPELVRGPACHILLPYTYAWDADPDLAFDDLLTMLEPADIAVAQQSLLFSAMVNGRQTLADLSRAALGTVRTHDFRRFLDRLWAEYHRLDFYRLESSQEQRATYLAARETMGLEQARERAATLLDHVADSLAAEASLRTQHLDARLNRVAAALTVVVAAAFAVDIAAFLIPDSALPIRLLVVAGVLVLSVGGLLATVISVRGWDRRRRRGHAAQPVGTTAADLALVEFRRGNETATAPSAPG